MRTVLHVGMNKTGSTSLQNALHAYQDQLRSLGILYPAAGRGRQGTSAIFHYEMSRLLGYSNTPAGSEDDPKGLQAELENEIAGHSPHLLILSSEYFCLRRNISRLQQFLAGHDLTIVIYLRRHDFWYVSLYAQAVASIPGTFPWSQGFAGYVEWLAKHPDHFRSHGALLDHWRAAFPAAKIVVRPLSHDLQRDVTGQPGLVNMVKDFFHHIDVSLPEQLSHLDPRRDNPSAEPVMIQKAELRRRSQRGEDIENFKIFTELTTAEPAQRVLEAQAADYDYVAGQYLNLAGQSLFSAGKGIM